MTDTVTRLMSLIENYRTAGGREEHWARKDALEAELTRLFTPLSYEQIHNADPNPNIMFDTQRIKFARAIEQAHGIGG